MLDAIRIQCPFCLQKQEIYLEPDSGNSQDLVIDCQVCCHPMDIHVFWSEEKQKFIAQVDRSSGF